MRFDLALSQQRQQWYWTGMTFPRSRPPQAKLLPPCYWFSVSNHASNNNLRARSFKLFRRVWGNELPSVLSTPPQSLISFTQHARMLAVTFQSHGFLFSGERCAI